MATATTTRRQVADLTREVARIRATTTRSPALDRYRADPSLLMADAGQTPDPWQRDLLRSSCDRVLMCCTRQGGKSTTAATLALKEAVLSPPALVLMLSPTLRQSGELFREKFLPQYDAVIRQHVPPVRQTALELVLANGSRVVSLPENESGIRGYSGVSLLVIDEASRVSDSLYRAVRPMLAVSNGKLVALSTPFGKRGWYFEAWEGSGRWERVKVTAHDCPRISGDFLREEWYALGERWWRQEYECSFEDAVDQVFAFADVQAAMDDDLEPLIVTGEGD